MKTTLNTKELKKLDACNDVYRTFKKAHGDETVTLTQAFNSNGWEDVWWYICAAYGQFSDDQKRDLRLLSADYAERVLPIFEKQINTDKRPRLSIKAARDHANGLISDVELAAARVAARAAAWTAARAAGDAARAAWAAARAAGDAAGDAGDAARAAARDAGDAERKWQEKQLLKLFAMWEASKATD